MTFSSVMSPVTNNCSARFFASKWFALIALFVICSSNCYGIIDITLQMQLGNPSGATADPSNHSHYLIQRSVEAIDYSDTNGEPNWASWDLTSGDVGSSGRSPNFFTDTNLPPGFYQVTTGDYTGSGYDRGHMCPSGDRTDNVTDNDMVFFMSNIIPQYSINNQGIWASFEDYCRTLATSGNELLITCGPSIFDGSRIASGRAAIPKYTWKIAVVVPLGAGTATNRIDASTRVIAIKVPNDATATSPWQSYVTSVNQIQVDTGFTFFTALPAPISAALRSKIDGQTNPVPLLISFSPASGPSNTSVVITGTNLNYVTGVTFNGTTASFTINTSNQITAAVPYGATTGPIAVSSSGGTSTSGTSFTVLGGPVAPDFAVYLSHNGTFTVGDAADTYSINVTNVGSSVSSGLVSITDALPAGLTATAFSGTGWTVNLGTLTATRSDALSVGAGYPSLTLTVSVATNATSPVTNSVTVSNANEINFANNTANDLTPIIPIIVNGTNYNGVLIGWDTHTVSNYGASPLLPTTNAPNTSAIGLTRGTGVATSGTAAGKAWGGVNFTSTNAAAAITANQFATFSLAPNPGYKVSFSAISQFDYRHSGGGPTSGTIQYQLGTGSFVDITNLSYPSTASTGASIGAIDLSSFSALQNVGGGTNVTFRIVNYNGASGGTWYIYDVSNSTALDFYVSGTIAPNVVLTPLQTWRLQNFGTITNSGIAADSYVSSADGMPNLLKYALGLAPFTVSTNPVVGDISTGFLRMTAPRSTNATDITFSALLSSDLVTWTTNGVVVDTNSASMFRAHDGTPVTAGAKRFMRLKVSE